MSIAFGFDPNVSPIYEDDEDRTPDTLHSVHFSSADTPKARGMVSNRTMGTTHIYEDSSEQFHEFHRECAPEKHNEEDSDEIVLDSTDKGAAIEFSEEVVPESRAATPISDEIVPDSTAFLAHTVIVVSAGCCLPVRHYLSKCLQEMGAELRKSVDERTTHLIVDRYAEEEIVGVAMARRPVPPLILDVKWIQECLDRKERCEEGDYSMRGCRYLKQTCRRLSNYRAPTPEEPEMSTEWVDMDYEGPEDPVKLLEEIRVLSAKLDALSNYAPVIRFQYHSPDCPTRQRPRPRTNPSLDTVRIRAQLEALSSNCRIRRRRSFTGYSFEHRNPAEDDVIRIRAENRDSRETWQEQLPRGGGNRKKATRTVAMTQDFRPNCKGAKGKTPRKPPRNPAKKRGKPIPVRADDSDIQSALASLTISTPPHSQNPSVEVLREESARKRAPLVVTKSNFINKLQETNADDDFISDVSAFHQKMRARKAREHEKTGVVFTGFGRNSTIEKKLKSILRRFKLAVATEIDESSTLCVISRHGARTLVVLKAICSDVPVVRPQWLEESFEDSQLLPPDDYVFHEWRRILGQSSRIFSNFASKMWIDATCQPVPADLKWMIEKCGGKVTRKRGKAGLVIVPGNWEIPEDLAPETQICTPLFIIESISHAELQNPEDYAIAT
ncbi:unnamed protein product [Caenorhabditis sp. 36 PRJEB53466]|nr:unnamed protein product [Caenorhabditis sp. 36 PRJEB53466]